tara:strand:- start:158 stop:850 length:693 start_codon:yes stop_codon:yes gene_type:complete
MDLMPTITTDFIADVDGEESEEEIITIEPEIQSEISREDIFDVPPAPVMKKVEFVAEEEEEEYDIASEESEIYKEMTSEPAPAPAPAPAPVKKGKKPCTEKQRLHLERIRIKGAETRRKNKEIRDKQKKMDSLYTQPKKEKKPLIIEPRERKSQIIHHVTENNAPQFTADDLENFTYKAIQRHETERKIRKQKKKQDVVDKHEENVRNVVHRAIQRKVVDPNDMWAVAFS